MPYNFLSATSHFNAPKKLDFKYMELFDYPPQTSLDCYIYMLRKNL